MEQFINIKPPTLYKRKPKHLHKQESDLLREISNPSLRHKYAIV